MDSYIKICVHCWIFVLLYCSFTSSVQLWHSSHKQKNSLPGISSHFQERSVLDHLTEGQLKKLLKQLSEAKTLSSCSNQFGSVQSKIIRAKDSLKAGAVFLSGISEVKSAQACRTKCCDYNLNNSEQNHCDAAIYNVDADDDDSVCYLFSCYNASNGAFLCLFSDNEHFVTYIRNQSKDNSKKDLPESVVLQHTTQMPVYTKTKTFSTTSPTTISHKIETTLTYNKSACNTDCSKFEWACDNHCCISVRQVCDGTPHCSDKSDENGCPTTLTKPMHSLNLTKHLKSPKPSNISDNQQQTNTKPLNTEVVGDESSKEKTKVQDNDEKVSAVNPEAGAVLPLAIGLAVTAAVLLMVACRVRIMKNKLRRRGKPLAMDESDYLINGMYL